MPRISANISIMFKEYEFLDRFAVAKNAGFDAVECWFPYSFSRREISSRLADLDLTMVVINSAHGCEGEWGVAALPGREAVFEQSLEVALDYATAFGSCAIHVMAGLVQNIPQANALSTYKRNLDHAVRRAERTGVQLLIEPLNRWDRPGYMLPSSGQALKLIKNSGFHDLRIMFDCYHVEMESGNLIRRLREAWPWVGHIQFAGVPGRGVPTEGTVDYAAVFAEIDRLKWPGWVGAEYHPPGPTLDSLDWLKDIRTRLVSSELDFDHNGQRD